MRRSFIGATHRAGSKCCTRAARIERQPADSNGGHGAMPVLPSSSPARNASLESPNGETTPTPLMEIGWATGPYVTIAIMRPQSVAAAVLLLGLAAAAAMPGLAAGQAPDLFDELYARGQKQNGNLRTFTAAFTETTSSSLLTRPLVASGTVAAERPGRV